MAANPGNSGVFFRRLMATLLAPLPPGALSFTYKTMLSSAPLRRITDRLLLALVPEAIDLPEGRLFLNKNDAVVSGALALGVYEPGMVTLFRKTLASNMVVVDIGANLGLYTLIASKTTRMVVAYEPEQQNATLLERTIRANGRTHVTLIRSALGDSDGTGALFLHPANKGKHSFVPTDPPEDEGDRLLVPITTLDRSLPAIGIEHVDVVKIDVEGWEAHVIRGMRETITRNLPFLFFEYAPARIREAGEDPDAMLAFLEQTGYRFALIGEKDGVPRPVDLRKFSDTLSGRDDYVNIFAEVPRSDST